MISTRIHRAASVQACIPAYFIPRYEASSGYCLRPENLAVRELRKL